MCLKFEGRVIGNKEIKERTRVIKEENLESVLIVKFGRIRRFEFKALPIKWTICRWKEIIKQNNYLISKINRTVKGGSKTFR